MILHYRDDHGTLVTDYNQEGRDEDTARIFIHPTPPGVRDVVAWHAERESCVRCYESLTPRQRIGRMRLLRRGRRF